MFIIKEYCNNSEEQKDNNEKNDNKIKELEKQIETLKEDMNKLRQSKIIETITLNKLIPLKNDFSKIFIIIFD